MSVSISKSILASKYESNGSSKWCTETGKGYVQCVLTIDRIQKIRLAKLMVKNFYGKYITSTTEHSILFSFPWAIAFHFLFEGRRRTVLVLHNLGLKWQHIYQQIRRKIEEDSLILPMSINLMFGRSNSKIHWNCKW